MRALPLPAFQRPRKFLRVVIVIPHAIGAAESDRVDCPRPDSPAARIVMRDEPDTGPAAHDAACGPWPNHALQRTPVVVFGLSHSRWPGVAELGSLGRAVTPLASSSNTSA